jgi:hypothetical protein
MQVPGVRVQVSGEKSADAGRSRESGSPLSSAMTWTPACAGATITAIFISLGGH